MERMGIEEMGQVNSVAHFLVLQSTHETLAGHLPPSLARLSTLTELSLVPGRVGGPLLTTLPLGLRFLALAGNLLSSPIPYSLATLRGLRTLDLSSNLLSSAIPSGLFRLRALQQKGQLGDWVRKSW